MLNFGASKPRVKGGARAPGPPPWIRACSMYLHEIGIKSDHKVSVYIAQNEWPRNNWLVSTYVVCERLSVMHEQAKLPS